MSGVWLPNSLPHRATSRSPSSSTSAHADLADEPAALAAVYTVEDGRTNPFLHLSMHLSIEEQCSIDQPTGIRQAVALLARRRR